MLAADAKLTDVVHSLDRPVHYVCGVLENLYKCKKAHPKPVVRIGITGDGKRPYYRVLYEDKDGSWATFDTFVDNHISFSVESRPIEGGDGWSNATMTLAEVAQLRGMLKG